jgi:GNAT superfamily N-acetyltransferase
MKAGIVPVGAAMSEEWTACRMLLPDTMAEARRREYLLALLARQDHAAQVVGAASYIDNGAQLEGLRVHVIAAERRRGIGSMLLRHIARESAQRGRSQILAQANSMRAMDFDSFLRACGFRVTRKFYTVEGDVNTAQIVASGKRAARGAIAPGSSIVPLSGAVAVEAGRLYAECIHDLPSASASRLWMGADLNRFAHSRVLLIGGQVQGLMLVEVPDKTALIHARIIRAGFRGTRASLMLLSETIEHLAAEGIRRARFQFFDSTRDTAKLARRLKLEIRECVNQLVWTAPETAKTAALSDAA